MQWFLDLSTRAKLALAFALLLLLLMTAMLLAWQGIRSIEASQQALVERDIAVLNAVAAVEVDLNRNRSDVLLMMLEEDASQRLALRHDIEQRERVLDEALQQLRQRSRGDAGLAPELDTLRDAMVVFRQGRGEIFAAVDRGDLERARQLAASAQSDRFEAARAIAFRLEQAANANAATAVAQSAALARQSLRRFVGIAVLAVASGALLTWLLTRSLAVPLNRIAGLADRIAEGDLAVELALSSRADEVGRLHQAFMRLTGTLRRQLSDLTEGINVLGSAASEISTSTSQLAASASETAAAVSQTSSTVEEVRQTAQVSSQKARVVADGAQRATVVSDSGRSATEATVAAMTRIQTQMDAIAESMAQLSERSSAVGQIVATVEDLAAQSKLLAVNASIEAAKAGEQGKGFAVVSQEVRSLAEQSRQATAQVRGILTDIQKATSAAVLASEQGSRAVEAGVQQSQQSGQAIQSLAGGVGEAALAAAQIAASSQQQLVGVDQVAGAMENIRQASAQNVDSARQLEGAAHNLKALGDSLRQLTTSYRF